MLTATQTARLAAFAALVWFLAALFIRWRGPHGVFAGLQVIALYALTVPLTVPLNRRACKLAGVPQQQTVQAIAVTTGAATMLDGVALHTGLYGADPAVALGGAAWLLWAIGVASWLGLDASRRAAGEP